MLTSRSGHGTLHLLPTLLTLSPEIINQTDTSGNNAVHHASAAGQLKALRILLQSGANPLATNAYSWTPVHYSATTAAETYFHTLIIEFEKKKAEEKRGQREMERRKNAGVRLVTDTEGMGVGVGGGVGAGMERAGPVGFAGGFGERQRARDDAAIAGLPVPGMEWSPVERRRAMTPTEGRTGWTFTGADGRRRADSGD
jgi:hypothetical protein